MLLRRFCLPLLVLCTLGSVALADQRKPRNAEAQRLLAEANRLYRVRDFAPAIEKYREGARLEDAPVFWYNLGQSHRQLGQYEQAIWFYRRYLSEGSPTVEERTYLEGFIDDMQREQQKAAAFAAPTSPGPVGSAPAREVAALPGAPSSSTPATTATETTVLSDAPPRDQAPALWYEDKVGWAIAGGGFVLGITGVALVAQASGVPEFPFASYDEIAAAHSRRSWGIALTVMGVGGLAAGVVKLVLVPKAPVEPVVSLAPGSFHLGLAGHF